MDKIKPSLHLTLKYMTLLKQNGFRALFLVDFKIQLFSLIIVKTFFTAVPYLAPLSSSLPVSLSVCRWQWKPLFWKSLSHTHSYSPITVESDFNNPLYEAGVRCSQPSGICTYKLLGCVTEHQEIKGIDFLFKES